MRMLARITGKALILYVHIFELDNPDVM